MAGVNLSQSMTEDEKPQKKGGISITTASILITCLVIALWGGFHYYLSTLDTETATYDASIVANRDQLVGERVDRVADFDTRVALFHADPLETIDPQAILTTLEGLVLPSVTLTDYEYNANESVVTLSGKTDGFRHLAEQILSFKREESLAQIKVEMTSRDKNEVLFTLKAPLVLK